MSDTTFSVFKSIAGSKRSRVSSIEHKSFHCLFDYVSFTNHKFNGP